MDFRDLDIKIGGAVSIQNDVSDSLGGNSYRRIGGKGVKDRRKNKRDRRKSVREGIFVTLSVGNDRRVLRDRRKTT